MGMWNDFKHFALKGNVLDLAIGVVIGASFTAIVNAVVDDIFMPIVGILTGGINLKEKMLRIGRAEVKYGLFLQATVTFIIVSIFLFSIIQIANKFRHKNPPPPPPPAPLTPTEKLLIEIRDQLAKAGNR